MKEQVCSRFIAILQRRKTLGTFIPHPSSMFLILRVTTYAKKACFGILELNQTDLKTKELEGWIKRFLSPLNEDEEDSWSMLNFIQISSDNNPFWKKKASYEMTSYKSIHITEYLTRSFHINNINCLNIIELNI